MKYAANKPINNNKRCNKPLVKTAIVPIHSTVNSAIHILKGLPATAFTVTGARFKPMIITTEPVTTGGMSFSIHFVPVAITKKPIKA